ncbi:MAG: hypothetical protein ACRDOU_10010 [Streptosporangiaceae bacterium]
MNSGSDRLDHALARAFMTALLHQGLIVLALLAVLGAAWVCLRAWAPAAPLLGRVRSALGPAVPAAPAAPAVLTPAEPTGRRLLRIGFGVLWLIDGILQAQPNMPAGLPSQVIEPTAGTSPPWVQHVVHWGQAAWVSHPVPAGSAVVWIQVGLGVWLLGAPRGTLSRLAGLASVGWGLVVWVFGESFGGIFAPGLTWLTGAPGAVLIYVAAGALIALPPRTWRSPRAGQLTLAGLGLFLAVMAGLQAQPSLGYWRGTSYGQSGPLASMVQAMSRTPQPGFLSAWVAAFGSFDEAHGFAVNLFVVAALAVTGAAFLSGRPWLIRPALIGFTVLCLADWVLVEDLGFLGGLGTDPNSMIPFILLASGGYLALTRPAPLAAEAETEAMASAAATPEAAARAVLAAGPFYPERRWCAPRTLLGGAAGSTFRS